LDCGYAGQYDCIAKPVNGFGDSDLSGGHPDKRADVELFTTLTGNHFCDYDNGPLDGDKIDRRIQVDLRCNPYSHRSLMDV